MEALTLSFPSSRSYKACIPYYGIIIQSPVITRVIISGPHMRDGHREGLQLNLS